MKTKVSIADRIAELAQNGSSVKLIRAHLTIEGFSDKVISAAIKEAELTSKKVTFASDFYDWLAEKPRSQEEAKEYIMDPANSQNVHNHLSHYLNIAELAARIWEAK